MGQYKRLFGISLHHAYYKNGDCKILTVSPTRETAQVCTNADLIFHPLHNGGSIAYNTAFTRALAAYAEENTSLVFTVRSGDPFFCNYTDCGYKINQVLYFKTRQPKGQNTDINLSKGSFVSKDDQKALSDKALKGMLSRTDKIAPPVGLININLAHVVGRKPVAHTFAYQAYNLHFRAKATYWRYNLIQKNDVAYDNLSILDAHNTITFTSPKEVTLGNGQTAGQITSQQPILLEQCPLHQFYLVGMKDNRQQIIMKRLAFPGVQYLGKEQNKEISDLYVYY